MVRIVLLMVVIMESCVRFFVWIMLLGISEIMIKVDFNINI